MHPDDVERRDEIDSKLNVVLARLEALHEQIGDLEAQEDELYTERRKITGKYYLPDPMAPIFDYLPDRSTSFLASLKPYPDFSKTTMTWGQYIGPDDHREPGFAPPLRPEDV